MCFEVSDGPKSADAQSDREAQKLQYNNVYIVNTYTLNKTTYIHTAKNAPLRERVPLNAGVSNVNNSSHDGAKVATVLLWMPAMRWWYRNRRISESWNYMCKHSHSDSTLNRDRKEKMQDIKMREHNQIDIIYTYLLHCVSCVFYVCPSVFHSTRMSASSAGFVQLYSYSTNTRTTI